MSVLLVFLLGYCSVVKWLEGAKRCTANCYLRSAVQRYEKILKQIWLNVNNGHSAYSNTHFIHLNIQFCRCGPLFESRKIHSKIDAHILK